jgi:hypothetical protein
MEPWLLDGGALELYQPPHIGVFILFFSHHYVSRGIRDGEKKRAGGSRTRSHAVPRFSANTQKIFFVTFFVG